MENGNKKEELIKKIEIAISKIRPYLVKDGGDIEFIELMDNNDIKVRLTGTCHNCPYSTMTLKMGIEQAIRQEFPELNKLIAI